MKISSENKQYMAFIIVSGYDDFVYCREALRLQITDYILKPVNYEEFGSCIDRLKIALYENKASGEPGRWWQHLSAYCYRTCSG